MRRLAIGLALGVLLAGTSAYASPGFSIVGVRSQADSTVQPTSSSVDYDYSTSPIGLAGNSLGSGDDSQLFNGSGPFFAPSGGALWDSFVTQNPTTGVITFESSNAVGAYSYGGNVRLESASIVELDIEGGANQLLGSLITPAGLGFYVANVGDGLCLLDGSCDQVAPFSPVTFEQFAAQAALGELFAEVGFEFSVVARAEGFADVTLYSLEGSLGLSNTRGQLLIQDFLAEARSNLQGFQQDTPTPILTNGGYHSLGFSWNATPIVSDLPLLNAGFQTVTYRTRVWSEVNDPCRTVSGQTACLIGYSGFGDPIGAGDVVESFLSTSSFAFGDVSVLNHGLPHTITGLNFTPTTVTPQQLANAVPEPATWLTMIMGFGLLGSVLRRRRAAMYA
jgi:hypothetical protein